MPNANLLRPGAHWIGLVAEIAIFSALILTTRCANYQDVFIGGKIYFVDADCYARMTRVKTIVDHPWTVVRHHDFENYPVGTTPHTTAPLDYLIFALAVLFKPFTAQSLDLAGAIISPLLGLCGGCFLWWWSRRLRLRYRSAALLLYALSPILVHGTELGRPDHQSLLILLLLIALAAEWALHVQPSRGWSVVSGIGWGMAFWVSLYEPLLLFGALMASNAVWTRAQLSADHRRLGWWFLIGTVCVAALIEQRWPQFPSALEPFFQNWSATVGELKSVCLTNPIWLHWFGWLLLVSPFLIAFAVRHRAIPPALVVLLVLTFLLTIWQARWGYFFAVIFILTIPAQIGVVRRDWLAALLLVAGLLLPLLQEWDRRCWPNEQTLVTRAQDRREAVEWRAAAAALISNRREPMLAPWWLSPAAVYWSGQPAVAGSSHESLAGIVESARFFLSTEPNEASEILHRCGVKWVLAYDAERVGRNSEVILGAARPKNPLCRTLDQSPSRAPSFLVLSGQNSACKVYRVRD